MAKGLVIVESPAKARTLEGFLGPRYTVKASVGHVRDLPKSRLGVDVEADFAPSYTVPKEKKKVVEELKKAVGKAGEIYLATDPDREGEAISWHLVQAMGLDKDGKRVRRVVFHEVTREAVAQAFAKPRQIDMSLVQAQQARRIIDRLVGYQISPLLWKTVRGRLSAGRVQSVAVRLLVEREREIQAFVSQEYWTIEAELAPQGSKVNGQGSSSFRAALVGLWGEKEKLEIGDEARARALEEDLKGASYSVEGVAKKASQRQPAPPFITSTLQQEAWRRLGFSAKRTMAVAQQLYEGLALGKEGTAGLITYMRTDSTHVAAGAIQEVRALVKEKYGENYLPSSPRRFGRKAPGAQEAHEAIRPTSARREPEQVKGFLSADQNRLYGLVWRRMLASQMANASLEATSVEVRAEGCPSGARYLLRASSTAVTFPGFLAVYAPDKEEQEKDQAALPVLRKGQALDLLGLFPEQHFTQPPARYSEATLVKALEEKGIGRPSTYAAILSTIQEREYAQQVEKRLRPTELGFLVNDLLVEHFPDVVDVGFTAQMEGDLDGIARGKREWVPLLREFYGPFADTLERARHSMQAVKPPVEVTDEICDLCGKPLVIKHGRFGRFLACSGYPECKRTRSILERASRDMERVKLPEEPTDEVCDLCGRPMVIKPGRFGRFLSCSGYPECKRARSILVKTGVACPRCGGELVEKKSKKGRRFYGCSRYPQCDFALPQRPVAQVCSSCAGLMVAYGSRQARCSSCGWREILRAPAAEAPAREEAKAGA